MSKFESLSDRNENQVYEETKKKHKIIRIGSIATIITVGIICVVFGIRVYYLRNFNAYKPVKSIERTDGSVSTYQTLGDGLYKFSRDGVIGYDADLNIKWSGSYDFTAPIADSCGSFVAVADAGGKEVYVFDGSDSGVKIDVLHPITHVQVASQGVVAIVMEDGNSDITQIIDSQNENELLVEFTTNVSEDGYPIDIALSNDGKKLVTSYLYMENGVSQTKLTFYNFGSVGQNYVKKIVKAKVLDQQIVSGVEFLGNDSICAFTEKGYILYSMKQLVDDIKEESFDKPIKSIVYDEDYFGFVLKDVAEEHNYLLKIYEKSGSVKLSKPIDFLYNTTYLIDGQVFFLSDQEARIININGTQKLSCQSDARLLYMMPTNRFDRYLLVDQNNISQVKLKEEK